MALVSGRSLADRLQLPNAGLGQTIRGRLWEDLEAASRADEADSLLKDALEGALKRLQVLALLQRLEDGSPYLTGLVRRDPFRFARLLDGAPEELLEQLLLRFQNQAQSARDIRELMVILRQLKGEGALLTAIADIGNVWQIMTVTHALTRIADAAVSQTVRFLFRRAAENNQWLDEAVEDPAANSGYFVLAMGKHGAFELNYSSDIDLIVFYDASKARLSQLDEMQSFYVRLTRDLVKCLSEQTADGFVFRTDLRLRPDPGATQVAMSTGAALHYYEGVGQNWERAAMIKARPVAGDLASGQDFLQDLEPFIWRKYLDYAAIADIHAMKRQIHIHRGFGEIAVAGHDIKVGRGGIREIEFFAQTQQLIAGGRQPALRLRETLSVLGKLAERGWIEKSTSLELEEAYCFLRWLEHRIQMVADQQTHRIPSEQQALKKLAQFAGFSGEEEMSREVRKHLETVQRHYSVLFEDTPQLSAAIDNLVFTGEDDDPGTLEALAKMGYQRPSQVIATIRSWHRGRYPAVRSEKVRERLTNAQPHLIEALSDTVDPDAALIGFDRFLSRLPAGIQLFSLLNARPELLRLMATIMGSAPRLAGILSRRPRLFDAVLDPRIIGSTPQSEEIEEIITSELAGAPSFEDVLDRARVIGGEQVFLVGARILTGVVTAGVAGSTFALLAEALIRQLHATVERNFLEQNGWVDGGCLAVVALGKLGGREMTASSDLDLITVYDFAPGTTASVGPRPIAPSQYYSRVTQRLISALSAQTREGLLYEVDMRLRPSGQQGPLATQFSSFVAYQNTQAWTWEQMALTRARVVSGPVELKQRIEAAIRESLTQKRDRDATVEAVREMRARIAKEKGTEDIWDLKQVRGGLVDIEFATQFLQLVHASDEPAILDQNTHTALTKLGEADLLDRRRTRVLLDTLDLIQELGQVTRLCFEGPFDPQRAPNGLKELIAKTVGEATLDDVERRLKQALAAASTVYAEILD
ncbi:MAG: bifunctional [glutamine synthetase] adenylyltransferase/[glutamine synthetase]-adenylyl-L-tyrosine phosphorylase [Hyphomicrobiaceae bacterium]